MRKARLTLMAPAAAFFFGLTSAGSCTLGGTITRSQTIQYVSNGSSNERSCIERDMIDVSRRVVEESGVLVIDMTRVI